MTEDVAGQMIAVRMYRTDRLIVVAAPMPGLEPQDITVTVCDNDLVIHGALRGPNQDHVDVIMAEWTVGPYLRELTLPEPVDGALANATYGNGVLVVSLPKAAAPRKPSDAEIRLEVRESTRGARVGHVGRDVRPAASA
jgi:HSP20 family protein